MSTTPPPPPPVPQGGQQPMSDSDARLWAMLCQLSGIFISFIGPLIVMLVFGPRNAFVKKESTEALNFQITVIIGYIIGGAIIGVLARFIKPGADPMGWILTIVLGIVGAVIGGQLSVMLGITSTVMMWVIAIVAAIVLLFVYEAVRKKKA